MIRRSNPVARSPLLRKGGAHDKSKSAKRSRDKRDIERESDEWENKTDEDEKPDSSESSS